jgi:hypothetical protein
MKLLYISVYIAVYICSYIFMFVCLQTARAGPLTPIGGVTVAEVHQTADIEVMELHQCE